MANPATNAQPFASTSLYVGDLVPDVTEAILFELFSAVGPVASIRVCRDNVTRRSLGYAYVNFHHQEDAERSLDTLNYTLIKGRPFRIMWSHRDPAMRKSGEANIFIKNLEKNIDNKSLYDAFSSFGNILSCKVSLNERGESRGFGFVHFETKASADDAIEKVNEMLLNGKQVYVGYFQKREDRVQPDGSIRYNNIYVKNLAESIDDNRLRQIIISKNPGVAEQIVSCVVIYDQNKVSRGFGFTSFRTPEAAAQVVESLNNHVEEGKAIYAGRAQKKAEREAELRKKWEEWQTEREKKYVGVNLYVKNLADNVDDDALLKEFAGFGNITSAKVMVDEHTKKSKGFGFVCFSSNEDATRAVTDMSGRMLGNKPLYVALAQRRAQRRAHLEATWAARQNVRTFQPGPAQPYPGQMYNQQIMYANATPGVMPPQQQRGGWMVPQQMAAGPRGPYAGPRQQTGPPQNRGNFPMNGGGQFAGPQHPRGGGNQPRQSRQPTSGRQQPQGQQPVQMPTGMAPAVQQQQQQQVPMNANKNVNANAPMTRRQNPPAQKPQGGPAPAQTGAFNFNELANLPPQEAKQRLGAQLYSMIAETQAEHAAKITGMLLELDIPDLLTMLDSAPALQSKIEEALEVLANPEKEE